MSRLIIDNQSDLEMDTVIRLVESVVKNGRISNNGKQYCYLTSFGIEDKEYHVVSRLNKNSDSFIIYNAKPIEQ